MRKLFLSVTLLALLVLPATAMADCADPVAGPFYFYGYYYYDYSRAFSNSCWTIGQNINVPPNSQTMSCTGAYSYDYRGANSSRHIIYTFTVKSDGITYPRWELSFDFEGVDPHSSWYNQLVVNAYVYHPGSGTTTTQIFAWNGTQGNYTSCNQPVHSFTAQVGDTITIDFAGAGSGDSDSHVMVQNPRLLRFDH